MLFASSIFRKKKKKKGEKLWALQKSQPRTNP